MAGRPKDPMALKVAKGRSHVSKDEVAEGLASEIYAAGGAIAPPGFMNGAAREMFLKEAAYMERVNEAMGRGFYGETDVEPLVTMVLSYLKFIEYRSKEDKAKNPQEKKTWNMMKNKEAATHERFMKLLKLDPASRVDFAGSKQDGEPEDYL